MATVTDQDLQQLKDLITAGNAATQKQIADLDLRMQVGFANVDTKFAHVEAKFAAIDQRLDGFDQRLDNIDQRLDRMEKRTDSLDARLWGFLIFIITLFVSLSGLLAKLAFFPSGKL
jgi:chromosome segregation ATPase